jgi:hypothetical protein
MRLSKKSRSCSSRSKQADQSSRRERAVKKAVEQKRVSWRVFNPDAEVGRQKVSNRSGGHVQIASGWHQATNFTFTRLLGR